MGWSLKLGKWFGIEVNLHVTFLLLIGFLALTGFATTRNAGAVVGNIGFLLALFLCVLLHEFGHALAARRYGISTKDITLLPIGGVAGDQQAALFGQGGFERGGPGSEQHNIRRRHGFARTMAHDGQGQEPGAVAIQGALEYFPRLGAHERLPMWATVSGAPVNGWLPGKGGITTRTYL